MTFTLTLSLPLHGSSTNESVSWYKKSGDIKAMRNEAWAVGCKEIPMARRQRDAQKPITIHAEFHLGKTIDKRYRPKDAGNAIGCLKPYIDGLVDAKLVPDDTADWVNFGKIKLVKDSDKAEVILTIVEDEA